MALSPMVACYPQYMLVARPPRKQYLLKKFYRPGERGAGLVGGNVDLDPVVLSEPVDVVAPVVTDALAARLGSAAGAGLSSKGSHSTSTNPSSSASSTSWARV
jgi:hypothetical protein